MKTNEIKNTLESLGFSRYDADIYLALLRVGQSSVGSIIDATKHHREIVYTGLKHLEEEGLIQSLTKKRVRHYNALDPEVLSKKLQKKADLATKILPDLKKISRQLPVSIQILEGPEGYEEIQKDIASALKNRDRYFVIGGAGDSWYFVTKKFYKYYHKRLYKRGIRMQTVTYENEAKGIRKFEIEGFNPIKILPDRFNAPTSTMIYKDRTIIHIFGESPLAIMIRSKEVSRSYKKYFDTLWKMGKDY